MEVHEKFDLTKLIKEATKTNNQQNIITIEFPSEQNPETVKNEADKMSLTDYLLLKSIASNAKEKAAMSSDPLKNDKSEVKYVEITSPVDNHLFLNSIMKTEKTFPCHFCGKCFRRNDHLKNHVRIHTGEKPYVCTYCSRAFNKNHHLKNHVRQHTGERPYQCDICFQRFVRNHHMKKHRTTHNIELLKFAQS